MEFRLLGGVEAHAGDRHVDLGPARQRCVLAVLLLDANRQVTIEQLVDRVWGDRELPNRPRGAVQTYVSLLRRALAGAAGVSIERRPSGYALSVATERIDMYRFRALVAQAREATDDALAAGLFEQALELWQGEALGDLDGPWCDSARVGLHRERHAARLDLVDHRLRQGQHHTLLATLSRWVGEHPLDERLAGQYLLALYRCDRQADALWHYRRLSTQLAAELGVDPSPSLQRLHRQIVTAAAELRPAVAGPVRAAAPAVPRQVPADVYGFTGRATHLADLDRLLAVRAICVVSGPAGVGKTALAVHWAHRVADGFPDGQLYVNLRGFDPDTAAVTPAEAIRGFLAALGVHARHVPEDTGAMSALLRSQLAGRRMLIVLDNARDTEQVRPLLPGVGPVPVIVTSRNQLSGLVAVEGAHPLNLDQLSADEARQLLASRLGAERVTGAPEAVNEIITYTARLPLALAIVAARAAIHPHFPLAALAAELRERRHRLNMLRGDGPSLDIREAFAWSYRALSTPAARLFRLLGLSHGPDIELSAAASLVGSPPGTVRGQMSELARAHLVEEHVPGRYALHDLLRLYAVECVQEKEPTEERCAADRRLLDHYLHAAYAAAVLIDPQRDRIALEPLRPGVALPELSGHEQALAWFDANRAALLAALRHTAGIGLDAHAHRLAWTLADVLDRRGHWHDQFDTQRIALAAATRLNDAAEQARAHRYLARAHKRLGRLHDALIHFGHALDLYAASGDRIGEGHAHRSLGGAWEEQGNCAEALSHVRRALDIFRACGHRSAEAEALNMVGWLRAQLGDHPQALADCQRALALTQDIGDRFSEAGTWDSIGYIQHHLGRYDQAVTCYHRALKLCRELGDRGNEATVLIHLGDAHRAAGTDHAARRCWEQALGILADLGHPAADGVRRKLARVPVSGRAQRTG